MAKNNSHIKVSFKNLDDWIKSLSTDLSPAIQDSTLEIAAEFQDVIAPYPPASYANQPKQFFPWYERGFGTRYPGGGGRQTSQTLGRKWDISKHGRLGAVLSNTATYAPYVHLAEYQAWFHGPRGWKTEEDAIKQVIDSGDAKKIIQERIHDLLTPR